MKKLFLVLFALSAGLQLPQQAQALEVDREVLPRITLGGRIISTVDVVDFDTDPAKKSEINIDDSALLLRFDKRLYSGGVAGAVLGFREEGDSIQFDLANAFFWNQDFEINLGRTRLRNTLIEFPTLRDEDLVTYTHVGNTQSNLELDQIYGKQISVDWFVDRKNQSLSFWAGSRTEQAGISSRSGFDSYGAGYIFELPEDFRYIKRLRHAGIMLDRQKVSNITGANEWLNALIVGVEFNLNINPLANWSLGLQAIANNGVNTAPTLVTVSDRARAKSNAIVTSLRYTARPKLLTRWQAALNFGYKDNSDISNASQWTLAPSFVYVLGQGVDLISQLSYTDFDSGLGNGNDTMLQVGLSFSFDARFNDSTGERNSILNLEHGYID